MEKKSRGDTERRNKVACVSSQQAVHQTPPLWVRLERKWNNAQVGRQGAYSVERLESFDHYCKTTSSSRAIMVCVLTPLPVLMLTIAMECLPLRPPSDGWKANGVFWIRMIPLIFSINFSSVLAFKVFLPGLVFPLWKQLAVSIVFTAGAIGFYLVLARFIGFPLPFTWNLGIVPTSILLPILLVIALGKATFAKNSPYQPHLKRLFRFSSAHMTIINLFPAFKVVYDRLPGKYQGVMIIMLPLWRFAGKRFVVRAARDLEDFMPESVAFIVDFFSALFVSVCMYNAGSIWISILVIVSDLAQSFLEFREVHSNANIVLELIRENREFKKRCQQGTPLGQSLISLILGVVRDPVAARVSSLENVRCSACLPHRLPEESVEKLMALRVLGIYRRENSHSGGIIAHLRQEALPKSVKSRFGTTISVVPAPVNTFSTSVNSLRPAVRKQQQHDHSEKTAALVEQGLQLLFHCEYVTLVEYVEIIVPLVFVSYKSVLELLPNVVFYPGGSGVWGWTAVANILAFSLLEIGSLVLLSAFLQRTFAFSPLYQLAFVLETQFLLIQAKLVLAIVCLLPYELAHLGGCNLEYSRVLRSTLKD